MEPRDELINNLRSAYDAKASERDGATFPRWKAKERDLFLLKFKKGRQKRILEIGCGTGRDSIYFKSKGFGVVATDLSPKNIDICKEKGLDAQVMNFYELDFPPTTFEGVYAMNCLLHAPKGTLADILNNISKLLRPSGVFYMGVYGGPDREGELEEDSYEPKRFFVSYTDNQIIEIASEFFELLYFHKIELERERQVHFQSMILRRKAREDDPEIGIQPSLKKPV